MNRKDIVFIKHEDDAKKWFGNNVIIEGGDEEIHELLLR